MIDNTFARATASHCGPQRQDIGKALIICHLLLCVCPCALNVHKSDQRDQNACLKICIPARKDLHKLTCMCTHTHTHAHLNIDFYTTPCMCAIPRARKRTRQRRCRIAAACYPSNQSCVAIAEISTHEHVNQVKPNVVFSCSLFFSAKPKLRPSYSPHLLVLAQCIYPFTAICY